MRILGIVPARGGSKRIPRKNLRLIGGKPLVAWAIETSLGTRVLDRVVVSSDDPEILRVAWSYGRDLPLTRPEELSGDRSPAVDYVRHAMETVERIERTRYDVAAIIQATSPLTQPVDIDATIALLQDSPADTAVSVMKLDHALQPAKLKRMVGNRLIAYLEEEHGRIADHELPTLYVRNGAVYASRRAVIDTGRILGDDCRGYVMPRERSIDINEEVDLLFAEFLLARLGKAECRPDGLSCETLPSVVDGAANELLALPDRLSDRKAA